MISSPPSCRPECLISAECTLKEACIRQKCADPCPGTCGVNARCQVINHDPICSCSGGFTGDPFIQCHPMPGIFYFPIKHICTIVLYNKYFFMTSFRSYCFQYDDMTSKHYCCNRVFLQRNPEILKGQRILVFHLLAALMPNVKRVKEVHPALAYKVLSVLHHLADLSALLTRSVHRHRPVSTINAETHALAPVEQMLSARSFHIFLPARVWLVIQETRSLGAYLLSVSLAVVILNFHIVYMFHLLFLFYLR